MQSIVRKFSTNQKLNHVIGTTQLPKVQNEPCKNYESGSKERTSLLNECSKYVSSNYKPVEIPCVINGKEIYTGNTKEFSMPANLKQKLYVAHRADKKLVKQAIEGAIAVREKWEKLPFEQKASIFLKAADLLSTKHRDIVNAATMMGQSKTMWQAEIDSAAEAIDFFRFNAYYASKIMSTQTEHNSPGIWNRLEYRGLDGFVVAISPFNFSSIGSNLACAPAQMGNVVIWKPAETALLSNYALFNVLREAGLPDGVIQFVPSQSSEFSDVIFEDHHLGGLHFTGSTATFNHLWKTMGNNLDKYKNIPRIVGETGGKNFHLLHPSGDVDNFVHQTIRSAFEYSGQKCSACSRAYIPKSLWNTIKSKFVEEMSKVKVGQPNDPTSFLSSVIDEKAFSKISGFIDRAKKSSSCEIVVGGTYSKEVGYFIHPTIIETTDPKYESITTEIFGPVLTIFVYEDSKYEDTLKQIDTATNYALTGAIFAKDRFVIDHTMDMLRHAAGNVYINDKSTGAVVGQQPFGGARLSGTNDKAGSEYMMARWTSIRAIKENFLTIPHWKYPSVDV